MKETKTTTMRITRDECRLFGILLIQIMNDKLYESLSFKILNLTQQDYYNAIDKMQSKFQKAGYDNRRNSERVKSNDYTDLMARLTKKYK